MINHMRQGDRRSLKLKEGAWMKEHLIMKIVGILGRGIKFGKIGRENLEI